MKYAKAIEIIFANRKSDAIEALAYQADRLDEKLLDIAQTAQHLSDRFGDLSAAVALSHYVPREGINWNPVIALDKEIALSLELASYIRSQVRLLAGPEGARSLEQLMKDGFVS